MLTSLEVLQIAESTLDDDATPYDFGLYNACTVGHIYAAASGKPVSLATTTDPGQREYEEVYAGALDAVCRAAGRDVGDISEPTKYVMFPLRATVSNATSDGAKARARGRVTDRHARAEALKLVRDGRKLLEAEYEAARLDVVGQMVLADPHAEIPLP